MSHTYTLSDTERKVIDTIRETNHWLLTAGNHPSVGPRGMEDTREGLKRKAEWLHGQHVFFGGIAQADSHPAREDAPPVGEKSLARRDFLIGLKAYKCYLTGDEEEEIRGLQTEGLTGSGTQSVESSLR